MEPTHNEPDAMNDTTIHTEEPLSLGAAEAVQPSPTSEPTGDSSSPDPITPQVGTNISPQPVVAAEPEPPLSIEPPETTSAPIVAPVVPTEEPLPTPVVVGTDPSQLGQGASAEPPKPRRKKKWFAIGGGVVLAALVAGYVFGFYLPSRPAAVWNKSLDRTGDGLKSLVNTAVERSQTQSYKAYDLSGTLAVTMSGAKYSGDFTANFDQSNLDSSTNIKLNAEGLNADLNAKVLAHRAEGSTYPDLYIQLNGLKSLQLDGLIPGLSSYDGKWIVIGSDYLKQLAATETANNPFLPSTSDKQQLTAQDISELSKQATAVTADYVFTSDPAKAVLVQKQFVGKEKADGISTYHYKGEINTDHARAYCEALGKTVLSSSAYKKLTGDSDSAIADAKANVPARCKDAVTNIQTNGPDFDVWVDAHYKLIHKLRIYDPDNHASFAEIGQTYKGNDQLALFANYTDATEHMTTKALLNVNLATGAFDGDIQLTSTDKAANSVHVTLKGKGQDKATTITPPEGAIKFENIVRQFMGSF